ncbi:xanthine dehydrogenase family protein molybdopterin-binding subunit [Natronincola ferrireducens]|uniref:CO or xanthine dehydrogenase, Mo-binding subunit n=1 Tax=Natronincola ferrireducens TaxID=393762 RepID=A0A1G8Y5Z5_9FIRM|nr:molybdopterin cofactor-binding domain-containing protein [Natronincola ferrireducens]SDJ98272.1 CO or xanthine dehydrogenase, Mo-binding subunit [Natronincola ferrireducens]
MSEKLKYVGKYIPIHDIEEKVTGKIKYVGDMIFPKMLHAKLLLSDIAHGRIINIDTSEAEKLPGVKAVYTYKNSSDTLYNSHKWIEGLEVIKDERLFTDVVRFYGDRIGAVVAEKKEIAEEAIKLIKVQYEELPLVLDPEEAIKEDSYKIHHRDNLLYSKEIKCGNPEEKIRGAEIVVEDKVETPKIHHGAMETHGCVVDIDSYGNLTVYTPCQVVFQVRLIISEIFNLPLNKVRVVKTTMGGSFGGKGQPILEPICAFLSLATKRPVKLILDRTEAILSTRTRTKTIGWVKTAVDKEGSILGRDIHMLVDAGAYVTNGDAVAMAMGKKAFKLYRIKDQKYSTDVVYTNTPIGGAARGYGSPQIHALTEINIDNVARALNMDPLELRLKNLVHPYDKDPTGGPELGNARVIDCVIKGAEAFKWKEKYSRTKDEGRFVRGVGMACAAHGNGYYGAYPDFITMSLRINEDGTAVLKGAIHDQGCGTNTTMMQIVAEVLKMDINKVFVPEADTLLSPYDTAGTQASRVTFVCGGCAKELSEMVREKLIEYSSEILKCSKEEITLDDGMIYNKMLPEEKMTYGQMVTLIQKRFSDEVGDTLTYKSPGNPTSYGVNFVEVEVDKVTGMAKIIDFLAVHDIGKAINKGFVEGQVQGAVQMGIGLALCEEFVFDDKGRIPTNRFSRYHVVNAPDMPEVKVLLVEDGEELGPFGAKSIGEACAVPTAPAIINAINNALDINITTLPATPERIVNALKNKM